MQKLLSRILFFLCAISFVSCGKGDGGGTTTPMEENLSVQLSPNSPAVSTSSSYPFTVQVLSKMPASGVKINVTAKREDNNNVVFAQDLSSTTNVNNVTVSPLPMGQIYCTVTVTVTSATTATNTWSGSFRVVWK